MPTNIVVKLLERVAALEARVEALMSYQKWQMALLSAIFMLAIGVLVKR